MVNLSAEKGFHTKGTRVCSRRVRRKPHIFSDLLGPSDSIHLPSDRIAQSSALRLNAADDPNRRAVFSASRPFAELHSVQANCLLPSACQLRLKFPQSSGRKFPHPQVHEYGSLASDGVEPSAVFWRVLGGTESEAKEGARLVAPSCPRPGTNPALRRSFNR